MNPNKQLTKKESLLKSQDLLLTPAVVDILKYMNLSSNLKFIFNYFKTNKNDLYNYYLNWKKLHYDSIVLDYRSRIEEASTQEEKLNYNKNLFN